MVGQQTFKASVDDWILQSRSRISAVVRSSAQEVMQAAQLPVSKGGNMPVDTGFLRASLVSSLHGGASARGPESYAMVIAGMEAGDIADFVYTAEYGPYVEYGANGRPGRHFVGNAAVQWPSIVARNVAKAKATFK